LRSKNKGKERGGKRAGREREEAGREWEEKRLEEGVIKDGFTQ
jgi:hypothetical protein